MFFKTLQSSHRLRTEILIMLGIWKLAERLENPEQEVWQICCSLLKLSGQPCLWLGLTSPETLMSEHGLEHTVKLYYH